MYFFQIPAQNIQGIGSVVSQAQQVAVQGQAIRLINPVTQAGQIIRLGVPSGAGVNPQSTIRIAQLPKGVNLANGGIRLANTNQLVSTGGKTKIVQVARQAGNPAIPTAPSSAIRSPVKPTSIATSSGTIRLPTARTASGQQVVLVRNSKGQIVSQPLSSLVSVVNQPSAAGNFAGKTINSSVAGQIILQTQKQPSQLVMPGGQLIVQQSNLTNQQVVSNTIGQLVSTSQTIQNVRVVTQPAVTSQNSEQNQNS